jgi:hypothetical protein
VLARSNTFVWRCPTVSVLRRWNQKLRPRTRPGRTLVSQHGVELLAGQWCGVARDHKDDESGESAGVPPDSAEFLRRAVFCESFAATLLDPVQRAEFEALAGRWRELAREAKSRA